MTITCATVPVITIGLNRDLPIYDGEVGQPPTDLILLFDLNPKIGQLLPHHALKRRFAAVEPIATLAAKPVVVIVGLRGEQPERLPAGWTDGKDRWASTLFGAVVPN